MKRVLIFDIGGIILDVSNEAITKFLGITEEETKALRKLVYRDRRFLACLKGRMTQEQYREQLIEENPEKEKEIDKILNPIYQEKVLPFISDTWNYICELRKQGYKIYFLSNLTKVSYEYLKEKLKITQLVDGAIYSWQEGLTKPEKEIYELLLDRYQKKREEAIFFDDKLQNIEMGNQLGIKSILYKSKKDIEENIN